MQLMPRHRYMLQRVDAAFGIYDEDLTEVMFIQHGVMDKVRLHLTHGEVVDAELFPVENEEMSVWSRVTKTLKGGRSCGEVDDTRTREPPEHVARSFETASMSVISAILVI